MRFGTLLWHGRDPVGICIFVAPPKSLGPRNTFFGLTGRWNRTLLKTLNSQLLLLQRVVLHPTYRGAGVAADFVRRSCLAAPTAWIETLTEMGHFNPFFERAGFMRVGEVHTSERSRVGHAKLFGPAARRLLTEATYQKSRHARPIYYVFHNQSLNWSDGQPPAVVPQLRCQNEFEHRASCRIERTE